MTFAFGANAPLSAALYAEAFAEDVASAADTLSALLLGGAYGFSLSEGGRPLSQGLGVPFSVDGRRFLYLYALATDKAARGQGLLRTLIKETAASAKADCDGLVLLPATPSLSAAYQRMGFAEVYPAGAPADTESAPYLVLTEALDCTEISAEEAYPYFSSSLSQALFLYTLSSLGDDYFPARVADGCALLWRKSPRLALAVSENIPVTQGGGNTFLYFPLKGEPPRRIPEPLPR